MNPVRARMVFRPKDGKWSSYRGTIELENAHPCLESCWLLGLFGENLAIAQQRYHAFVVKENGDSSPLAEVRNQIYLGFDEFIAIAHACIDKGQSFNDIPKPLRRLAPRTFEEYAHRYSDKKKG